MQMVSDSIPIGQQYTLGDSNSGHARSNLTTSADCGYDHFE